MGMEGSGTPYHIPLIRFEKCKEKSKSFILFNKKWDFFSHFWIYLNNLNHRTKSSGTMHTFDLKL